MKTIRPFHASARRPEAGFSLIELLISMVIGMVVVGAVIASYLGTGTGSRHGRALSQITEDASISLNVLRAGIAMVGYGKPTGVDAQGHFTKAYGGQGLFGCDSGFTDPSLDIASLTCNGQGSSDAIAVAYEADANNSVVNNDTDKIPLDCLGNTLTSAGTYYLNYSRYYVSNNQLFCRGPGSDAPAALVDNVVDLQVTYGVFNPAGGETAYRVSRYMTATQIGADTDKWSDKVVSARICVVIRSADEVLDEPAGYQGCNGWVDAVNGDRHMYRAFTTTVVFQNRLGAVL